MVFATHFFQVNSAGTGARSQVANLVAAVLVLVTLGFLAPVFDWLPTSTLAAIVMVAGFGLLDLGELRNLWRFRRSEFLLAISTIGAVLAFGMLAGIVVAIGLSLLVVVLRAATPNTAVLGRVPGTDTFRDVAHHHDAALIPGILVYRFDAPLFFANAPGLRDEIIRHLADGSTAISNESPSDAANSSSIDTVVIDMEAVYDVDSTGVEALLELLDALDRSGIGLELARVRTHVRQDLEHAGIRDRLAGTGIHLEVDDAVDAFLERRRDP